MGKIMFDQYDNKDTKKVSTTNVSENVYFFQAGVYSNLENMKNATSSYHSYSYLKENDKYYVFLGITKNEENKEKLKKYFEELALDVYIKQITMDNAGFLENLDQYDILLKTAKTKEEIQAVNDSILAKYEELVNNGKN